MLYALMTGQEDTESKVVPKRRQQRLVEAGKHITDSMNGNIAL